MSESYLGLGILRVQTFHGLRHHVAINVSLDHPLYFPLKDIVKFRLFSMGFGPLKAVNSFVDCYADGLTSNKPSLYLSKSVLY